jgi:large subunit ribosomal protein L5
MERVIRMKKRYYDVVIPKMMEKFKYKNKLEVPKLSKIVINVGLGEAKDDIKLLDSVMEEVAAITGQKPIITRAKKSISSFKIREGMPIGCKVTLRRNMMYEFFDRLVSIALPRIRDFKGVPLKSFDGRGNITIGIKEQTIFPEIDYDKIKIIHGMDITICTTAKTNEEAKELLSLLGLVFEK